MKQPKVEAAPTLYEVIHVHPAAPLDLITAAYWKLSGLLQAHRSDRAAEVALYHLTRSYETLADHRSREAYDRALGLESVAAPRVPLRRRSSWLPLVSSRNADGEADVTIDYYEIMRLDPRAHPAIVSEAYSVMRNWYLRLVERGLARPELVDLLEEAHEVLSDSARRAQYDERRPKRRQPDKAPNEDSRNAGGENGFKSSTQGYNALDAGIDPESQDNQSQHSTAAKVESEGSRGPSVQLDASDESEPTTQLGGDEGSDQASKIEARLVTERDGEENDATSAGRATARIAKSIAAASAAALAKGGKTSVKVTLATARALKEAIDRPEESANGVGPADAEEAVLARVFVSAADKAPATTVDAKRVLARLTVSEGPSAGLTHEIYAVPLTFGSDGGCDVRLPGLAPQQARVLHHGGQFILHSLSEDPVTYLESSPVSWSLLRDGDSFQVGPYRLRFSIGE